MTNIERARAIVTQWSDEGDSLQSLIADALAEAERRGMLRAAELCRTAGYTGHMGSALSCMANNLERLANKEQS